LILGSIRLPPIIRILKIDPKIAGVTHLFIGFFMGIMDCFGHAYNGHVNYQLLIIMGIAAAVGSYIGARLTGKLSINKFILILGIGLTIVGVFLIIKSMY